MAHLKFLFISFLVFFSQVSIADDRYKSTPKYFGLTTNPMLASSDTMALPYPLRGNLHAKLFPYASLLLSYGMIDDKPLIVAQGGGYLSEREYSGRITGGSIRVHPTNKLDGFFGQYSLERISWKKYCYSPRHSCSEADKNTTYKDWAHLTLLGYGKFHSTIFFMSTYFSAAFGVSWGDSVRASVLVGRIELGLFL